MIFQKRKAIENSLTVMSEFKAHAAKIKMLYIDCSVKETALLIFGASL